MVGIGSHSRHAWWWLATLSWVGSVACGQPRPAPEPTPAPQSAPAPESTPERTVAPNRAAVPEQRVRQPAVAGGFYPDHPDVLRNDVDSMLAQAQPSHIAGLRALVCPHAGYKYSGPIAASGFKQLAGLKFERVVVMAPSHHVLFAGVAIPDADVLRTPLGDIPVDDEVKQLAKLQPFVIDSAPHAREHALEVELPFLQRVLGSFKLVPLVFGEVDEAVVAQRLNSLVDADTFFVASSDLSHYYPYEKAKQLDHDTVAAIVKLDVEGLQAGEACGKSPVLALVHLARLRGWKAQLLDYRNSGDTAGDRSRVVGYAAIAFFDSAAR